MLIGGRRSPVVASWASDHWALVRTHSGEVSSLISSFSASQVMIMSTTSKQNTSRGIVTIMYICIFKFQTFKASHMPATWVGPTDQNLGEIRGIKHDQRINVQATVTTVSINTITFIVIH